MSDTTTSESQKPKPRTAPVAILAYLAQATRPLAVHEMDVKAIGYSQNCIATRLPEMAKPKQVIGRFRRGENFKEWVHADKAYLFEAAS